MIRLATTPTTQAGQDQPLPTYLPDDVFDAESLDELAGRINRLHDAAANSLRRGYQFAVEAGRGLIEARRQVPKGQWEVWVRENCDFSLRTAQVYISFANSRAPDAEAQHAAPSASFGEGMSMRQAMKSRRSKGKDAGMQSRTALAVWKKKNQELVTASQVLRASHVHALDEASRAEVRKQAAELIGLLLKLRGDAKVNTSAARSG